MKVYVLAVGLSYVNDVLLIMGMHGKCPIAALRTDNVELWNVFNKNELFYVKVMGLERIKGQKFQNPMTQPLDVYMGRILEGDIVGWSLYKKDLMS